MGNRWISIVFLLVVLLTAAVDVAPHAGRIAARLGQGLSTENLRGLEEELRHESAIRLFVVPRYQAELVRLLRRGTPKVHVGTDGWLFYGEDLDHLTSGPFPGTPIDAIADFRDQLAARGVKLLLVPVPAKGAFDTGRLGWPATTLERAEHPDEEAFFAELRAREVDVVDLRPLFASLAPGVYLERDTHWTPRTLHEVARLVADEVRAAGVDGPPRDWQATPETTRGDGDLTRMLQLPEGEVYEPMTLETDAVGDPRARAPFVAEPSAPILLLGDSFTRVFSDASLGLGEHAGFAEQLGAELRTAVDVIAISGGSGLAVREAVARRGLDGKALVVWQISMRDLSGAPRLWQRVELRPVRTASVPDTVLRVRAEITKVSRVPEGFDYAFCLAVYEYRVLEGLEGPVPEGPLSVAHVAIENHVPVAGSRYEVGDVHTLRLERAERHYDLEQTSWVDDTRASGVIWFATE